MKKNLFILWLFVFSQVMFSQTSSEIIQLYKEKAIGSENWNWEESVFVSRQNGTILYNVTSPKLRVFRPEKTNGYGVVVCPGGGFLMLSITKEGEEVAKELQSKGFTVFLLSYRLAHLSTKNPLRETALNMSDTTRYEAQIKSIIPLAISDGKRALAYVRENAQKYKIDPHKIGIMGFSAGGGVALGTAFNYTEKTKPDFVAAIYPHTKEFEHLSVPANAPHLFMAAAANDALGNDKTMSSLYNRWRDSVSFVEVHLYSRGGHGFGVDEALFPTNTWINRFYEWLALCATFTTY